MKRLILICCVVITLVGAGLFNAQAQVEPGCPGNECEYYLQVCPGGASCYWLARCIGGELISLCTNVPNGCRFEVCNMDYLLASAPKRRQLSKVPESVLEGAAAIDPFIAMALQGFEGVTFNGIVHYKFPAYQYASTEAARGHLKGMAKGQYETDAYVPTHWSEKLQKVQPDTEEVTLQIETPSDVVTILRASHGGVSLAVKFKKKGDRLASRLVKQ